jgi:hypothetical protein
VFFAPSHQREQNLTQGFSLFRQLISVAYGMFLIRRRSNEPRLFQSFQAVGKDDGGNTFGRILQLAIGHITSEQVPNHQQRSLVANEVERSDARRERIGKPHGCHTVDDEHDFLKPGVNSWKPDVVALPDENMRRCARRDGTAAPGVRFEKPSYYNQVSEASVLELAGFDCQTVHSRSPSGGKDAE